MNLGKTWESTHVLITLCGFKSFLGRIWTHIKLLHHVLYFLFLFWSLALPASCPWSHCLMCITCVSLFALLLIVLCCVPFALVLVSLCPDWFIVVSVHDSVCTHGTSDKSSLAHGLSAKTYILVVPRSTCLALLDILLQMAPHQQDLHTWTTSTGVFIFVFWLLIFLKQTHSIRQSLTNTNKIKISNEDWWCNLLHQASTHYNELLITVHGNILIDGLMNTDNCNTRRVISQSFFISQNIK